MQLNFDQPYDGFHFLPNPENEESVQFHFFRLQDNSGNEPIDDTDENVTSVGPVYNVLLMKQLDDGIKLNDIFEAVFSDPTVYAEGLIGSDLYGTFVRKTKRCDVWWNSYVERTKITIDKINNGEMDEEDLNDDGN